MEISEQKKAELFSPKTDEAAAFKRKILGLESSNGTIKVGEIPFVLTELGYPYGTVTMPEKIINKSIGQNHTGRIQDHNLTVKDLLQLPEELADPFLIVRSKQSNERQAEAFLLVTHIDVIDKPMCMAVWIEPLPDKLGHYTVHSIYEHDLVSGNNTDHLANWQENNQILYAEQRQFVWFEGKKNSAQPGISLAQFNLGLYPHRVTTVNNIPTKDELVKNYCRHQDETIFLFGGDPAIRSHQKEYRQAEDILTRRGFNVVSPAQYSQPEHVLARLPKCTAIAMLPTTDSNYLGITAQGLAAQANLPCVNISRLLPPLAVSQHTIQKTHDPLVRILKR